MEKARRITALLMVLVLLLGVIPFAPVTAAVSDTETAALMKFVETGYNEETGILSMTLKVKPQNDYIRDGAFAFRVNMDSLIPISSPANGEYQMFGINSQVSYIADESMNMTKDFKSNRYAERLHSTNGFNVAMNANKYTNENDFNLQNTGYFVSTERGSREGSSYADCYFQFNMHTSALPGSNTNHYDDNGYVDIITLHFLTISGFDQGEPFYVTNQ